MSWRPSPAAENLPNLPTLEPSSASAPPPTTPSTLSIEGSSLYSDTLRSIPPPISSPPTPFTPAQCPDPRRTQRGSRPRGPTPAPSPTAHPTSYPASCNRRTTRSRLSRLHHRLAPMVSPRRRSRRLSACGRRHGLPGWLSRARVWIGGLSPGGDLRIARTRAWFIR
jgi:hypothetical protein